MRTPPPAGSQGTKVLDPHHKDLQVSPSREFEDRYELYLRRPDDFFCERRFTLHKAVEPIPHPPRRGSILRLYGERGFPVRALDVDGREVFYLPREGTIEGWWADVLARPGSGDEILYSYAPRSWRAFLPGAPKRIHVTRRNLVVATSAGEETFPLYDYLWAEAEYSRWAFLGVALMLLNLLVLAILQPHPTPAGALAFLCVHLCADALSRSEDLYVSAGRDCTGRRRRRRCPIFGRDPDLRAILDVTHRYKKPSEKRYWRELLPSTSD